MREIVFKMERPGLLQEGDDITVTEGVLPSNYYYTIDPSLAMSPNIPFRERLKARKGRVVKITENEEPEGDREGDCGERARLLRDRGI